VTNNVESDDAIEEQEARRVAAEDSINECRLFFPGALMRKAGLAIFDAALDAGAAAEFVEKTWGCVLSYVGRSRERGLSASL